MSRYYLTWVKHTDGTYQETNEVNIFGNNLLAIVRKGSDLLNESDAQQLNYDDFIDYQSRDLQDAVLDTGLTKIYIPAEGVSLMLGTGNMLGDNWNLLAEHPDYAYGQNGREPYNDIRLINSNIAEDVGDDIYLKWKPNLLSNPLENINDCFGVPFHFRVTPYTNNLNYQSQTIDGNDFIEIPNSDVVDYSFDVDNTYVKYVIINLRCQDLFSPYYTNNLWGYGIEGFSANVNARWIQGFRDIAEGNNVYVDAITNGINSTIYDGNVNIQDMTVNIEQSALESGFSCMCIGMSLIMHHAGEADTNMWSIGDFNKSEIINQGFQEGHINIKTNLLYESDIGKDFSPIVTSVNSFTNNIPVGQSANGDITIFFENYSEIAEIIIFDNTDFSLEGTPSDSVQDLTDELDSIGFNYIDNSANYGSVEIGSQDSLQETPFGASFQAESNSSITIPFTYTAHSIGQDSFTIYVKLLNVILDDNGDIFETEYIWYELANINANCVDADLEDEEDYVIDDNEEDENFDNPAVDDDYEPDPDRTIIQNPIGIMFHLAEQELGYKKGIDAEKIDEARINHDNWRMDFSVNDAIEGKDLFNQISQSCKSIPVFSNDKFSFFNLKNTYRGGTEYYTDGTKENIITIKEKDVINYQFTRTDIENIATKIDYRYYFDYGLETYVEAHEIDANDIYKYHVSTTYGNLLNFDPLDSNNYVNYYGLKYDEPNTPNHIDTTKIFEDAYIIHNQTALKNANFMLGWYYNVHNQISLTLPLKYYNLELGDLLEFDKMLLGKKIYGEKYVLDTMEDMPIRCGQYILPLFIINSIKKDLNKVEIEATQLHHIGTEHLNYKGQIYPPVKEVLDGAEGGLFGDINGDGQVDINDLIMLSDLVLSEAEYNPVADLDGDGVVSVQDLVEWVDMFFAENQRSSEPNATNASINYGNGSVFCKSNGEIAAFEMTFNGSFKGVNCLGDGWQMKIRNNKMLIWSNGRTPLSERLFNYIGELEITSVKFVNWNKEIYYPNYRTLNRNFWKRSTNNWNSDGRKPEEIEDIKLIHKKIAKTKV